MIFARRLFVGLVAAACLMSLSIHDSHAQTEIVIQPDPAAGKDASVEQGFPDFNYGDWDRLTINFTIVNHGLIEFDLSSVPASATITGATLEITEQGGCAQRLNLLDVRVNEGPWDEATVTWNTAPPFSPAIATNYNDTVGCEALFWDVTGAVRDWVSGAAPNNGFRVTGPYSDVSNVEKQLYSSDHVVASERPLLRIEYFIAVDVPTVTEWGMVVLSVLIALSAVIILWGRNRVMA